MPTAARPLHILSAEAESAATGIFLHDRRRMRRLGLQIAGAGVVVAGACWATGLFDTTRLATGIPDFIDLTGEMLPPNFSDGRGWIRPVVDTLAMSVAGTALAVLGSIPLGFLAARNTAPHPLIQQVARIILNFLRAVPELIMGIIFVAAVGFGALPGVLALGFHSIGMIGKFFAEAVEHVDPRPVEAARAAGAGPLQCIVHAILPQVLGKMADVAIYRWEYNFRASTILGAVGAGGIGFELIGSLRIMQYTEVSAIILVILVMVTLVDGFGSWLRTQIK
jgi:phosphonate transport system permease protein